ncbi:MAG: hypothetical protein CVV64_18580 [Candidatus Wallbacteria bacterium HGW-Wallbacteria-1]|uniref:Uncharacterized protein n=1 Tax=Candidatus Wallbacteria bacterium HGW-Wallbacteria-1 TaxID=2013854 RepID=A0A2N1PJK1_9BACT|nr:MAG: hypothetical protein CVV64_18580 [Candidatus Wallbacteria bacterium HGW-Wallbacteria-1]
MNSKPDLPLSLNDCAEKSDRNHERLFRKVFYLYYDAAVNSTGHPLAHPLEKTFSPLTAIASPALCALGQQGNLNIPFFVVYSVFRTSEKVWNFSISLINLDARVTWMW